MTKTNWTKEDVRKWANHCHVEGWPILEIILMDFADHIEADGRDAARYRWLREHSVYNRLFPQRITVSLPETVFFHASLDDAIDAAMQESGEWTEGVG